MDCLDNPTLGVIIGWILLSVLSRALKQRWRRNQSRIVDDHDARDEESTNEQALSSANKRLAAPLDAASACERTVEAISSFDDDDDAVDDDFTYADHESAATFEAAINETPVEEITASGTKRALDGLHAFIDSQRTAKAADTKNEGTHIIADTSATDLVRDAILIETIFGAPKSVSFLAPRRRKL